MNEQQIDKIIANIREELKYWDKHLWSFLSGSDMRDIIRYLVGMKQDNKYFVPSLPVALLPYVKCKPERVKCIIITSLKSNSVETAEKYRYPMSPANKTIKGVLNTVSKERSIATDKFLFPDISRWTEQGVLQVSTAMTSELNGPHHYVVWKLWTQYIINKLNDLYPDTPVILIGAEAVQYKSIIKSPHQYIVRTWPTIYHNDCWCKVNEVLLQQSKRPIVWNKKADPTAITREEAKKRRIDRWVRKEVISIKRYGPRKPKK